MKLFYGGWLYLTHAFGATSQWLWGLVVHWLRHPLGFVVVPLLLLVWAPVRMIFERLFWVLSKMMHRKYGVVL